MSKHYTELNLRIVFDRKATEGFETYLRRMVKRITADPNAIDWHLRIQAHEPEKCFILGTTVDEHNEMVRAMDESKRDTP